VIAQCSAHLPSPVAVPNEPSWINFFQANPGDTPFTRSPAQSSLVRPDAVTGRFQMTQQIVTVASPLGIAVHDHIIVGKDGHASMKGLKLI
jgi:hypothetical protein